MNESRFRDLLVELIDENPFAIRATLKILQTEFTEYIPTLAVTCEDRPRLLVNLSFVSKNCHTDEHVKAVICHEFLHVLLRHTEQRRAMTQARHLALDAVINAVIHRQYGPAYSGFMSEYYRNVEGVRCLLRPMTAPEKAAFNAARLTRKRVATWQVAWEALYDGKLVVDDIESLSESVASTRSGTGGIEDLVGNHEDLGRELPDELADTLRKALREMNGSGIWRSPKERGIGANSYEALFVARQDPLTKWKRRTLAVLREHLVPDRNSRAVRHEERSYRIPVLSTGDRRAFLRANWAPFLPEATWTAQSATKLGSANVYLDVSGSMNAEMPHVIALLGQLSAYIRRPFWAFSDHVVPAVISGGQLRTATTGGTSITCVLEHIAATRPTSVVIVTDGYIEDIDRKLLAAASPTRIHVLLTRNGNPRPLETAGLPYSQLEECPS